MEWWLVAVALVVLLVAVAVFVPIRVGLSLRARGDPSGAWALAGGCEVGPLVLSGVGARGVPAMVVVQLFGRRVVQRPLSEIGRKRKKKKKKKKKKDDEREPGARAAIARARRDYARLERWFDPLDLLLYLLQERRRIVIDQLELDVGYSFRDVALTGKTLAALYVLSGVVPPPIVIRPSPSWESVDRADLALSGSIRLFPGLLLVDTAWFVIRRVKLRKRRAGQPSEAT